MSHAPALGLHKDGFGSQITKSSMNGKSAWDMTWQPWMMLQVGIVGDFFGMTFESRHDENCDKNLGLPWSFRNYDLIALV